ncbi:PREDICTED: vacuolar amino acid transporter 1 isoform X5 [Theobroma cacao]|uniref:Vacuolar amino acid transporter 1 isoform X4 n=1 Tax=Theobroma cacao TaxID=3641 RepID=A0AB32X322_THECC|nr:PREDICTED: vacuolar amino acid transporter 1 isoform X4 [Theobroma cacao]XP_017984626.1 PREDICTED: vacuolar amino acid transporter 1 isoform X5 [Theobroma cacao]
MKNSVSDQSFYIESEDEEDEEKVFNRHEGEDDGNESDVSDSSAENQQQNKPSSYNTSWPQSYRQSIDLYSSVPSPSIGFLGTPTLSRLGSSFLSSSLTRRHTPESLSAVTKPLVPTVDDQIQPYRRSSHSLLPPIPSRRQSVRVDDKTSKVSHELPISRQSSYGQAVLNGINVLCGVGILSTPYAAKEGGWLGLIILFTFAVLSFYTGLLLRQCLDSEPGLETYPDIGQAAFGTAGRIAVSIILYVELYACCVEYIILEGDNLSSLFPNAHISLGGFELNSQRLFALMTTLAVLPTVWLRDLSVLSYISAGGVVASILVVLCLFWVGLVDQVGFHNKGTTLNLASLPVAVGLYGYCYSGHAVFPNIYTSMAKPNQFPSVLIACFGICSLLYAGTAIMGYTMFGEATESQFTLNMPKDLIASKIAVWTTVVNPFTKYALTMSPVAMSLEELIPSSHLKSHIYAILIRTSLVISTLIVGLSIPFFGWIIQIVLGIPLNF